MVNQIDYEEGDVVLCTVKNIVGTTVFVDIDGDGDGSIVLSEIAPGRIRNLRDYVVPHKKIVCKILKKGKDHYQLSLRRVTEKERKQVMDDYKKEKSGQMILKSVLKDKCPAVLDKIEGTIADFLEEVKKDAKILEKHCSKEEIKKLLEILTKKKEKQQEIKKEFYLKSNQNNGIKTIKKILDIKQDNLEIKYLGNSKFRLIIKDKDLKKADQQAESILENIKTQAKKQKAEFSLAK